MSEPFVAEIRIFPYNFAPRGWAFCQGQLLPISQNTALFSLVGTAYGGDGRTTFGLPDLRDRFAIGVGNGPGLSSRRWGEKFGAAEEALTEGQMPSHQHNLNAASAATTPSPDGAAPAPTTGRAYRAPGATTTMAATVATVGQSAPHENRQPALELNFCIALVGLYPSRG